MLQSLCSEGKPIDYIGNPNNYTNSLMYKTNEMGKYVMSLNVEPMEISKDLMNKDERHELASLWNISFDMASSKDFFAVGVFLVSPVGTHHHFSFRLEF